MNQFLEAGYPLQERDVAKQMWLHKLASLSSKGAYPWFQNFRG